MAATDKRRTCDVTGCGQVARWHVRSDIPHRDATFTSLMWARCSSHTPEHAHHLTITPLPE